MTNKDIRIIAQMYYGCACAFYREIHKAYATNEKVSDNAHIFEAKCKIIKDMLRAVDHYSAALVSRKLIIALDKKANRYGAKHYNDDTNNHHAAELDDIFNALDLAT